MAKVRTGTAVLGLLDRTYVPGGGSGGAAALTYAQTVAVDTPAGYWKLDEASGNVADSSGNALTLTKSGSPTYRATGPGTGNFGITFTAANSDKFTITDPGSFPLDLGNTMTLEAWVKVPTVSSGVIRQILGKFTNAYVIGLDAAGLVWILKSQVSTIVKSTTALPNTGWNHVVYTKSGATSHVYINGVDVTDTVTDATMADNNSTFTLGTEDFFFDGTLSHVAVYATALSSARVSAHFAAMV